MPANPSGPASEDGVWASAREAAPVCFDAAGLDWMKGWMARKKPLMKRDAFVWMLQGDCSRLAADPNSIATTSLCPYTAASHSRRLRFLARWGGPAPPDLLAYWFPSFCRDRRLGLRQHGPVCHLKGGGGPGSVDRVGAAPDDVPKGTPANPPPPLTLPLPRLSPLPRGPSLSLRPLRTQRP